MSDIERRLRDLGRTIGGPSEDATHAALERARAVVAGQDGSEEALGQRRRRWRIGRRRGLLILAGAIVIGSATAVGISTLGGGEAAPVACEVLPDRGAGAQHLTYAKPSARVDGDGDAVIAWVARGGTVQATTRAGAGSWEAPAAISPDYSKSTLPRSVALEMDDQGRAVAGWTFRETTLIDWDPGSGWSARQTLAFPGRPTVPDAPPTIALTGRGQGVAVFTAAQSLSDTGRTYAFGGPFPVLARRDAGGPWRVVAALRPRQDGLALIRSPRWSWFGGPPGVVLSDVGTTTIAGPSDFGAGYVRLSRDDRTRYSGLVDRGAPASPNPVAIGQDGHGDVLVVWLRGTNLVASRLTGATGWQSQVIANTGLYTDVDISLAVNGAGDAVVAYRGRARGVGGSRFHARSLPSARRDRAVEAVTYSAAAGRWSVATQLSGHATPASQPAAGIDARGRAVVAWAEGPNNGDGSTRILAVEGSGGAWSAPRALSPAAPDPLALAMDVAASGRALVAWTGCHGSSATVRAAERSDDGWFAQPRVVG